jgi:spermidine synthase
VKARRLRQGLAGRQAESRETVFYGAFQITVPSLSAASRLLGVGGGLGGWQREFADHLSELRAAA